MKRKFKLEGFMFTNKEDWRAAGYTQMKKIDAKSVYLWNPETGQAELWFHNQNHASYGVIINGKHYEFASSTTDVRYCDEHNAWESK